MIKKYLKDDEKLMSEFSFDRNSDVDISTISLGMNMKLWWKCNKGHQWQASPNNRQKTGCPYCNGKRICQGINDLESQFPKLVLEWDYDKNGALKPSDVSVGSNKKVWWECNKGHSWQSKVSNRTVLGRGCPFCSNQQILEGYNDLGTLRPGIADEWCFEKNNKTPSEVGIGSAQIVWWCCKKYNHEWKARITDRVRGTGCPYCSGKKTLPGFNDLATVRPELLLEWDYDKNDIDPTTISPVNGKKVWWTCFRGHSYESAIYQRSAGKGCPYCIAELKTSFPEQAIYYYLKKVTEAENRYNDLGKEIDVYLPNLKVGIEYNGEFYHKDKQNKDKQKKEFFIDKGIRIISVNEGKEYSDYTDDIEYAYSDGIKGLEWVIKTLYKRLGLEAPIIDLRSERQLIYEQYINTQKEKSLLSIYPDIAETWDYEKNGSITPDMVSPSSKKEFWWKCKKGHTWQSKVSNRTVLGRGCPFCSSRKVLKGFNDLETLYPQLAKEWHPSKNGNNLPSEVFPFSNNKAWWLGACGHEWQASIENRANGNGCPICANHCIMNGENDLATIFPDIAEEWDYDKNNKTPYEVGAGSSIRVWWRCRKCNHQWITSVVNRTRVGSGCPCCAGKVVKEGYNDLKTTSPQLLNEWNYSRNSILPEQITQSSNKKVWWKCSICNYEWMAMPANRKLGRGCPVCANKIIIPGYNDLNTICPSVAAEWIYEKNEMDPTKIGAGSSKKCWWKCSVCGHEWQAIVVNRTRGHGCPLCARKHSCNTI